MAHRATSSAALLAIVAVASSMVVALTAREGGAQELSAACPAGQVPDEKFSDVDDRNVHQFAIACLSWDRYGIATGRGDGTFGSSAKVTRAQMAAFLARLLTVGGVALPSDPGSPFSDIHGHVFQMPVEQLSALGIVKGTGRDRFSPNAPVSRGQMATLLVQSYRLAGGDTTEDVADHFRDDDGNVHETNIDRAAVLGLTSGKAPDRYDPSADVRRDQMASFLARLLDRIQIDASPFFVAPLAATTTSASMTVAGRAPPYSFVAAVGGVLPVSTTAGPDGWFRMDVPLEGGTSNDLTITASDDAEVHTEMLTVSQLGPGSGVVTGTVLSSASEQPIAGAMIRYGQSSATTDAAGAFSLSAVPNGSLLFSVEAAGHLAGVGSAQVTMGTGTARPTLLTALAAGVDIGPDGASLAGENWVVDIPSGALDEPTSVQVTPLDFTGAKDVVGIPVVDISPSGLTFDVPITVRLDPTSFGLTAEHTHLVGFDPATRELHELDQAVDGNDVVARVTTVNGLEIRVLLGPLGLVLEPGPWNMWGSPFSFCTPFEQADAANASVYLRSVLLPFLYWTVSPQSRDLYDTYLTPGVESERREEVVPDGSWGDDPEIQDILKDRLRELAAHEDFEPPPLRAPESPAQFDLDRIDRTARSFDLEYSSVFSSAGNLAGGMGEAYIHGKMFEDERFFDGWVSIVPEVNENGALTRVDLVADDVTMTVLDAIDFCRSAEFSSGDIGGLLEWNATIPLSRLEVTHVEGEVGTWAKRTLFEVRNIVVGRPSWMTGSAGSPGPIRYQITHRYPPNDPDLDEWPDSLPWPGAIYVLDNCPGLPNPEQREDDCAPSVDLTGKWHWVDESNQTGTYEGTATIEQDEAGTFTWEWTGSTSEVHYIGSGTVSGRNFTLEAAEGDVFAASFIGSAVDNDHLVGTWRQSDRQDGTFTATRIE